MKSILESKLYDENATIQHVQNLAFPRKTATPGETEAIMYIEEALGKDNTQIKFEHFSWTGPKKILMRLVYVILFIYLVLYKLLLLLAVYFAIKYSFATFRRYSLTTKEESKNLYTKISAKNRETNKSFIIFCAHYDSFSAKPPYRIQSVLFFIFRVIIIPIFFTALVLTLLVYFYEIELYPFEPQQGQSLLNTLIYSITITEFIIVILIFLLVYDTKKSAGSIDNASGVSILIELEKILRRDAPENVDVLFLFSGAEEWGLVGSKMFCKRHRDELQEEYNLDKSYCINIDMVGTYIGLFDKRGVRNKQINKNLNEIIKYSANKLDIPLISYNKLISPNSDYRSFRKLRKKTKTKLQVTCIHSHKDNQFIHSAKDTPDKCSPEILNGCLEICYDVVQTIDSNLEDLKEIR